MKQTGQILKEAREAQKLTVNEVAMATKINPRMIRALEEGDLEALPAKTFLRGFVRSYAGQLKLDVDKVLETFMEEMGSTLPEYTEHPAEPVSSPTRKLPNLGDRGIVQKVLASTAIILLILLIIGVKKIVEKYEREGEVEPPTNIEGLANEETKGSTVDKDPSEDSISREEVATEAEPEKKEPPSKKEPAKTEVPPEEQKNNNINSETKNPEPPVEKEPEEPVVQSPPPEKPTEANLPSQEIILEALDNVVVEFRINKGQLQKVTLKPDQIHTIKAKGSVAIDLSDGGAVNIIHNGQERGVPGDLGVPKKVKLP